MRSLSAILLCAACGLADAASEPPLPRANGLERGEIVVTHLDDHGAGSLRAALALARKRAGIDRVRFAPGLAGTLALGAPLAIDHPVVIIGPGRERVALDAALAGRHFEIAPPAVEVSISGLALRHAVRGAVRARGVVLSLDGMLLANNIAGFGGAIAIEGGVLHLRSTLLRDNAAEFLGPAEDGSGGAIHARRAEVLIERSEIAANEAAVGGGIYIELAAGQSLVLRDSAVHGNYAPTQAGGMALQVAAGSARIVNSTVSGNRAERNAAIWFDGPLAIDNSTIAGNRSVFGDTPGQCPGLCAAGRNGWLILSSSIVAGNVDHFGNPMDLGGGRNPPRLSHSLVQSTPLAAFEDLGGNRIGVDPLLLPLAGGDGAPPVHALAPGSPARDAGLNQLGLETDQRGAGFPRSAGAAPDIGAYEAPAG